MAKKEVATIRIKLVRSPIRRPETQKKVVQGLGFRRLHQVVERPDNPGVRGMLAKIPHLVQVIKGDES